MKETPYVMTDLHIYFKILIPILYFIFETSQRTEKVVQSLTTDYITITNYNLGHKWKIN